MAADFGSDGFPVTSEMQHPEKQKSYAQHFDWLCRSWAIAGVFHFLTFHDWRWQGLSGVILIALALVVIRRPVPTTFSLFLAADIYAVASRMGPVPNHILFSLVMNIGMLAVMVGAIITEKRTPNVDVRGMWVTIVAPMMRMSVSILYFFTVFHKINRAYFNPDVSCASTMLHEIGGMYPIIPAGVFADTLAIYGTLLIEGLITILMFIPRTRLAGGVLALGFHAMLSLHPHPGIYSFTATIVSLLSWFIPSRFFTTIQLAPKARKTLHILWFVSCIMVTAALLVGVLPSLKSIVAQAGMIGFSIGYYGILVYSVATGVAVFFAWLAKSCRSCRAARCNWMLITAALAFVPARCSACPYRDAAIPWPADPDVFFDVQ